MSSIFTFMLCSAIKKLRMGSISYLDILIYSLKLKQKAWRSKKETQMLSRLCLHMNTQGYVNVDSSPWFPIRQQNNLWSFPIFEN